MDNRMKSDLDSRAISHTFQAYLVLEREIVTLRLAPGQMVTEGTLIDKVGLGRTPVREAIQRLEWEGLLDIRPRSGICIAPLNPTDFPKVIEARRGVEIVLAQSAARFASPEHDDALRAIGNSMSLAVKNVDIDGFLDADKRFDEVLGEAAANPFAARLAAPLQTHSRRFWFRLQRPHSLSRAVERHVALMEAIIARDADLAQHEAKVLIDHLIR
jgi:DNA-binding GntR family transcriptional regulator